MSAVAALGTPASSPGLERIRQQATELEGVFLNTLMREMFNSVDTDNGFGGGFAEETWRGMQAEQLADAMAGAGGIGLADAIMSDLLALQEAVPPTSSPPLHGAYK